MLKLTEHLKTNDLSTLTSLGITSKRHPTYNNLVQLKYSQIESPSNHPLVVESRGIILDENDGWKAVALPFFRFFNLGDAAAAQIDWSKAVMTEKLDGSLIIMYFYDGKWNVATSGTPDASGQVNGYPWTFGELFWDTFHKAGLSLEPLEYFDPNYTFMFELMTPYNRIVVPHKGCSIKLIGIRNRNNGRELPPMAAPTGWPYVKSIPVYSDKEVVDTFVGMSAINQEGWVVVDENFNRVKVKHPQYIVLHHMRGEGSPSPKRALEVVLAGEHEEVLTYWPEWKPLFEEVENRVADLVADLVLHYERIKHSVSQKDFAMEANKTKCSGALFCLRANKTPSIYEYLKNMRLENLVSILELHTIKADILMVTPEVV